jgi:selenocysteine-specific translation elongation factor
MNDLLDLLNKLMCDDAKEGLNAVTEARLIRIQRVLETMDGISSDTLHAAANVNGGSARPERGVAALKRHLGTVYRQ